MAELPSLQGNFCECSNETTASEEDAFCVHSSNPDNTARTNPIKCNSREKQVSDILQILKSLPVRINNCYNLMRRVGKEIIVTVVSDIDRVHPKDRDEHVAYMVPIQYYIGGSSHSSVSDRKIIIEAIDACTNAGLNVVAVCIDGAYLDINYTGESMHRLTS